MRTQPEKGEGGGIGRSSFLKKGGPKSKGEALEEGRRGDGTEGWCVPHHPIHAIYIMHSRKIKNEMSLDALWLI